MAVTLDSLSPAARDEAATLGLVHPERDLPGEGGFAAYFAAIEENWRRVSVAECRALFDRYQKRDAGDLDRFRECYAAFCFEEVIERLCQEHLGELAGSLHRRVELFLGHLLAFKVAGNVNVAEVCAPVESRFARFRGQVGDRSLSCPQLVQAVKSSANRSERQAAWEAFVDLGRDNRDQMLKLVAERNRLARTLGHRDFIAMRWKASELDETWMLGILDQLEAATHEAFEGLRGELQARLGLEALEPWDLVYGIEQLSPLPPEAFDHAGALIRLQRLLKGWGFSDDETHVPVGYADLGFSGLCFGIEPGREVAILLSSGNGPRYYRTFFHEFGHAMHFRNAGQDHKLLNEEDAIFNEAMAVFFEVMVSDPAWVRQNLELSEPDVRAYHLQARYAALNFMRNLLQNIRFEHALYTRDELDPDAFYLALQRRCFGFDLPATYGPRWASDQFLASMPVYWQSYLIAELIVRQTREHLTRDGGSLVDNPKVGRFLVEHYYRPGASLSWLEKVARATERPLDGEAFFRYIARG